MCEFEHSDQLVKLFLNSVCPCGGGVGAARGGGGGVCSEKKK